MVVLFLSVLNSDYSVSRFRFDAAVHSVGWSPIKRETPTNTHAKSDQHIEIIESNRTIKPINDVSATSLLLSLLEKVKSAPIDSAELDKEFISAFPSAPGS
jgi:hypothetical protein